MILWGCFSWVPTFYTLSTWCAVRTWPVNDFYDSSWFIANVIFGALSIWLNYETDRQRQVVRATGKTDFFFVFSILKNFKKEI